MATDALSVQIDSHPPTTEAGAIKLVVFAHQLFKQKLRTKETTFKQFLGGPHSKPLQQ